MTSEQAENAQVLDLCLQQIDECRCGRAFSYFRDPLAVNGIPETIRREIYVDTDPEPIHKREALKQQIRTSACPVLEKLRRPLKTGLVPRCRILKMRSLG